MDIRLTYYDKNLIRKIVLTVLMMLLVLLGSCTRKQFANRSSIVSLLPCDNDYYSVCINTSMGGAALKTPYLQTNRVVFDTGSFQLILPRDAVNIQNTVVLLKNIPTNFNDIADLVSGEVLLTAQDGSQIKIENFNFYVVPGSGCLSNPSFSVNGLSCLTTHAIFGAGTMLVNSGSTPAAQALSSQCVGSFFNFYNFAANGYIPSYGIYSSPNPTPSSSPSLFLGIGQFLSSQEQNAAAVFPLAASGNLPGCSGIPSFQNPITAIDPPSDSTFDNMIPATITYALPVPSSTPSSVTFSNTLGMVDSGGGSQNWYDGGGSGTAAGAVLSQMSQVGMTAPTPVSAQWITDDHCQTAVGGINISVSLLSLTGQNLLTYNYQSVYPQAPHQQSTQSIQICEGLPKWVHGATLVNLGLSLFENVHGVIFDLNNGAIEISPYQ